MTTTDAWVLDRRRDGEPRAGQYRRMTIDIGRPSADEVIAEPLYGSWEANMSHALDRQPIDVCAFRGEDWVVTGNAGIVRVVEVGRDVSEVEPGQLAIMHSAGRVDDHGHMTHALGYDCPDQMGCLATRIRILGRQLIAVPESSRYSPRQWAGFGIRYVTAWANWEVAGQLAAVLHGADTPLHVWGWGGGTTLAELDLARRQGHRSVMVSGSPANLDAIGKLGLDVVDRRQFSGLSVDPDAGEAEREVYLDAERVFLGEVAGRTDATGVHVFVDYVGGPVWRVTLKALARRGVVTTAGWKEGMRLQYLRAVQCIAQQQLVHTHFGTRQQAEAAMRFGEAEGWMPPEPERVYSFDEIPDLAEAYRSGATGYYPCYSINDL